MKQTMLLVLFGIALVLAGCSKKNSDNPLSTNPGNETPANVTFSMGLHSGTQGMIIVATPSEDVLLAKVDLHFPAQNFTDTVTNGDPTHLFPKGVTFEINEYVGIEGGQQWVIVFHGTLKSNGKPFTVTVNWTVV
ncbi:MAG: hypothetical protein KF749_11360 [Bacteroidetes bacterium]|nr:hypothetical protein [Bacteroidota bacterium]MCW5897056.1 hypothetical protein [Bacteroidota bacterium]